MQDSNCDDRQGSRASDMSGYDVAQRKTGQDGMLTKKKTCQDIMEVYMSVLVWCEKKMIAKICILDHLRKPFLSRT